MHVSTAGHWLVFLLCLCRVTAVTAEPSTARNPAIALIIDDLGYRYADSLAAAELPGPVACAFLPYGPFTRELAGRAHRLDKEVMLHLPMQAAGDRDQEPEAGTLTLDMTRVQMRDTLARDLAAVPHVSGLNNHRGSLLTRHPGYMAWLMQAMSEHGRLFFIDSRTTTATVAKLLADEFGVPSSRRDVFLDNAANSADVRAQFRHLLRLARRNGSALAIGHPYPATLQVLQEEIPQLGEQGIRLVPVARLIELQEQERQLAWQTY